MNKRCNCGHDMDITLRTVVHARTIEIHHVPVYTCAECDYSELLPELKQEVIQLMKKMMQEERTGKMSAYFDDVNEVASVLKECVDAGGWHLDELFQQIGEERVNHLLDLYLMAKTWNDKEWMCDIQRRLKQISGFRTETYRVKIS
ncbi:hypothetical protein [Paenibacillus aquistagni]|uniref:hypothetical protein n=1 Tax=Paenibacillus aquistagni TaxID=1852522 RepID=UPI000B502CC4|nr:hypothetical protein [Paenibacillus aquistagni]